MSIRHVYWDSCVFLSYLGGVPNRIADIKALLYEIRQTKGIIYTSELTKVEVAYTAEARFQGRLNEDEKARIEALWADENIELVEFQSLIGDIAVELVRDAMAANRSLKPMDAIHLATAKWLGVTEFHTYDRKLRSLSALVGFKILEPKPTQGILPFSPQPTC